MENLFFPIADGGIKTSLEEIRNWEHPRIGTASTNSRRESHIDFLGQSEGSLPQPQDSFPDAGEAINDFLVHVRKLHILPSRWTQSQALLAERGIIPYSTKIHWRIQNYSYEFGCQAREDASMIIGILMGLEICLILGQVSHNSLYQ